MKRARAFWELVVLVCASVLVGLTLDKTMAADEEILVDVRDVSVQKIRLNVFHITAKGVVRTSGWVVNLHPVVYTKPPENWVIDAVGVKPTGSVEQVITSWEASAEMSLSKETRQITVRGRSLNGKDQVVTKTVPW